MVDRLDIIFTVTFLIVTTLSYIYWGKLKSSPQSLRRYPSPPGPPSMWPIGNLHRMQIKNAWLTYMQWKDDYGPLVYLHGFGHSVVILNTQKAISDLFDKRGSNYSHRPIFVVLGKLMGAINSLQLMPYGNTWRMRRKLVHKALNVEAVKKYHAIQEDLAALMCRSFLEKPKDFIAHVRLTSGRIIMTAMYGLSAQAADDKYIPHAEETLALLAQAAIVGKYLADLFPSLLRLPSWVPFTTFRKDGLKGRRMVDKMVTEPFEHVQREMKAGTASPSFAHDLLDKRLGDVASDLGSQGFEDSVKWLAWSMYGAGMETTYATVLTFILAMILYPEVQKKAQKEIDEVVGTERLPVFEDRSALHYVNAVVKETMRWHPVLPLGLPHQSDKDDVYEGYFIPAGTIVIPNVWAVSKECASYPSAEFVPERFLEEGDVVIDPYSYAFGFGRRICPGRHFGDNNVFILITSILACFNISPPIDDEGREISVEPQFAPDISSHPERFECRIVPRSEARAVLIKDRASSTKV